MCALHVCWLMCAPFGEWHDVIDDWGLGVRGYLVSVCLGVTELAGPVVSLEDPCPVDVSDIGVPLKGTTLRFAVSS